SSSSRRPAPVPAGRGVGGDGNALAGGQAGSGDLHEAVGVVEEPELHADEVPAGRGSDLDRVAAAGEREQGVDRHDERVPDAARDDRYVDGRLVEPPGSGGGRRGGGDPPRGGGGAPPPPLVLSPRTGRRGRPAPHPHPSPPPPLFPPRGPPPA